MSYYTIALFVHIVGVIVVFAATAVESLCLHRLRGSTTTDQLKEWASLSKTTAMLSSLGGGTTVITGIYLSLAVWGLTVPWIGLSLAGVAVMAVLGRVVNSRRLEAIAAATETEPSGPIPAELSGRVHDPVLLASVHTVAALGLGVVFLDVAKPELAGSLAALAVAVIVGVLSAPLASRRGGVPVQDRPISPAVASERS